mmetsp:Transcript_93663/g.279562  ORF Transcript_93663/g.279562 Transcript_93663/m.279562 type:complete len:304 (+) Transcript_93663:402-1313(+)
MGSKQRFHERRLQGRARSGHRPAHRAGPSRPDGRAQDPRVRGRPGAHARSLPRSTHPEALALPGGVVATSDLAHCPGHQASAGPAASLGRAELGLDPGGEELPRLLRPIAAAQCGCGGARLRRVVPRLDAAGPPQGRSSLAVEGGGRLAQRRLRPGQAVAHRAQGPRPLAARQRAVQPGGRAHRHRPAPSDPSAYGTCWASCCVRREVLFSCSLQSRQSLVRPELPPQVPPQFLRQLRRREGGDGRPAARLEGRDGAALIAGCSFSRGAAPLATWLWSRGLAGLRDAERFQRLGRKHGGREAL